MSKRIEEPDINATANLLSPTHGIGGHLLNPRPPEGWPSIRNLTNAGPWSTIKRGVCMIPPLSLVLQHVSNHLNLQLSSSKYSFGQSNQNETHRILKKILCYQLLAIMVNMMNTQPMSSIQRSFVLKRLPGQKNWRCWGHCIWRDRKEETSLNHTAGDDFPPETKPNANETYEHKNGIDGVQTNSNNRLKCLRFNFRLIKMHQTSRPTFLNFRSFAEFF